MSGLIVSGDTSGAISVVAPAVAGSGVLTLPLGTGTLALPVRGTFTGTWSGFASSFTPTIAYTIIDNVVTMRVPDVGGTSNATTKTLTGLPAAIQPANLQRFTTGVQDNGGTYAAGLINMNTGSTGLALYKDTFGTAWTASGTCNINGFTITYLLT